MNTPRQLQNQRDYYQDEIIKIIRDPEQTNTTECIGELFVLLEKLRKINYEIKIRKTS